MTTPPVLPINESKDSTVARCCDGIIPFRYACRIGISAAKIIPQTTSRRSATQKAFVNPSRASTSELAVVPRISAVVRRSKSARILGARYPPAICEPATMAAARPAIAYASLSPQSSRRNGCAA